MKTPKSSKNKKISNKSAKQRTRIKEKKWMDELTNSIMNDISKSPMFTCSTPVRSIDKDLVEITPCSIRDIEIEEPVTPYPNYSSMGDALLKVRIVSRFKKEYFPLVKVKRYLSRSLHNMRKLYIPKFQSNKINTCFTIKYNFWKSCISHLYSTYIKYLYT